MTGNKSPFLVAPPLAPVPGLVHGFGDARWSEADFLAFAGSRGLRPVIMRQLHSDIIHRIEAGPAAELEGDALMTDVPGLLLVIRTADCLPALLVDEDRRAVAAVHCGWRGTGMRILEKSVRAMGEAYGSTPAGLKAALGPCIGAACYEVGPEVREGFLLAGFPPSVFAARGDVPGVSVPGLKGKFLLDLRAANAWLLGALGVKKENIFNPGAVCTHCDPRLFSYRRHPADPRRMYNFIGLTRQEI
ncbi:MAG TPA: peptidoglycan editing factor PgeF [Candidatus Aminicenantes bacterium]|nr:peptidoglycan editing factor PgeF [Candidatus Aminicenantes bacterium]HRY63802.1 peptidoglycan editing factor PgeF [Candidatus Aminicenantes bacterium]HRZ70715.1 peptidoglycan editing factor PgeF [Candidatus Aminicenantes bacterium]